MAAYGVIQDLAAALQAADQAKTADLLGFYPAAAVVLAEEVKRLQENIAHMQAEHAGEIKDLLAEMRDAVAEAERAARDSDGGY